MLFLLIVALTGSFMLLPSTTAGGRVFRVMLESVMSHLICRSGDDVD